MRRIVVVAAVGLAIGIAVACSESRSPCSTGAPRTTIPDELSTNERNTYEQSCVPRCGDVSSAHWGASGGPLPAVSALPTGACTEDGERCRMDVVVLYDKQCCPRDKGQAVSVICECRDGTWACGQLEYIGGGVCTCLPDGGPIPPPFDGGCPPELGCPGPLDGG